MTEFQRLHAQRAKRPDRAQLQPVPAPHPQDLADRGGIQVIARAASILRALENHPAGLSLGELAGRVTLARSTVQRIVKALTDEHLLMSAGPLGGVTLGPLLLRLAAGIKIDVVQLVRPYLESLSRRLDETVDLSMIDGDDALFIDQAVGSQRLAAVSRVGERFALHTAANGKALLAALGTDEPGVLDAHVQRLVPKSMRPALAAELSDTAANLIAFDRDEHTVGVSAVGTWFCDAAGIPYALSIPVPSMRFDGGRRLIEPLLATRRQIIAALASGRSPAMTRSLLIIETENTSDLATYRAALAEAVPALRVVTAASEAEALSECDNCDAIAAKAQYIPKSVVGRMRGLRWIQALTTGVDPLAALDIPADVAISSVRGIHGPQMAELTLLLMLSLARDFPKTLLNQGDKVWQRWPQRLLDGRTLLIVGVGAIGEAIAARAAAFGMRVIGASDGRTDAPGFQAIAPYRELPALVARADFVVVVTPYSARTHNLIDASVLRAMSRDAFLINVSRGRVVDEGALLTALQEKWIAGAALDVFEQEPLPAQSPLWHAPNLIITPHVGGMSDRYAAQVLPILMQNARAFADDRLDDLVNRIDR